MPAAAAFDPFPDQQDEGEGDFGISALFPDAGEYADDELQHQEVLESSSSSSISLQATHPDMEHDRHSKTDGWILPQFPVQVLGGEAGECLSKNPRDIAIIFLFNFDKLKKRKNSRKYRDASNAPASYQPSVFDRAWLTIFIKFVVNS